MFDRYMDDTSGGASLEGVLMMAFLLGSCGGIAISAINGLAGKVSPPPDAVGDTNRAVAAYRAGDPDALYRLRAGDDAAKGAQSPGYGSQAPNR